MMLYYIGLGMMGAAGSCRLIQHNYNYSTVLQITVALPYTEDFFYRLERPNIEGTFSSLPYFKRGQPQVTIDFL